MKYFQLHQKKSNFVSSSKQPHVSSGYNLQSPVDIQKGNHVFKQKRDCKTNGEMGKCKTKAIHGDLGIFTHIPAYSGISRHIQAYSGIIQAYSEPCVTLAYSELIYSKSWHIQNKRYIQNPSISKTLAHSELETYSESWAIQNRRYTQNLVKHL